MIEIANYCAINQAYAFFLEHKTMEYYHKTMYTDLLFMFFHHPFTCSNVCFPYETYIGIWFIMKIFME